MTVPFDHPALYPTSEPVSTQDVFLSLRPEEKAFVSAYLASLSSSAASAGKAVSDMLNSEVDNSDRARQFLAKPRVRQAIAQRARQLSAKFEITANSLLKEIAHIAFANPANYIHLDEDGIPYYDFRNVTFEQMSAIAELTIEETGLDAQTGKQKRKVKMKLHNKQTSHDQLMKYLALYSPERHVVDVNVKSEQLTVNMTAEQLADIWQQRLKEVNQ